MTFRTPQLVRVTWRDRRNRPKWQVAMGRLARSEGEAMEIAQALEYCMIPGSASRIIYQISLCALPPTMIDATSLDTHWRAFWREGKGIVKARVVGSAS